MPKAVLQWWLDIKEIANVGLLVLIKVSLTFSSIWSPWFLELVHYYYWFLSCLEGNGLKLEHEKMEKIPSYMRENLFIQVKHDWWACNQNPSIIQSRVWGSWSSHYCCQYCLATESNPSAHSIQENVVKESPKSKRSLCLACACSLPHKVEWGHEAYLKRFSTSSAYPMSWNDCHQETLSKAMERAYFFLLSIVTCTKNIVSGKMWTFDLYNFGRLKKWKS